MLRNIYTNENWHKNGKGEIFFTMSLLIKILQYFLFIGYYYLFDNIILSVMFLWLVMTVLWNLVFFVIFNMCRFFVCVLIALFMMNIWFLTAISNYLQESKYVHISMLLH